MLCTGTPSPFINERVYWPNRCWRGTSGSPWWRYSIWRCFMSLGEADVMVRRKQETGAVPLQPFADRGDLLRRRLLFGQNMVEPEHHQGVGVGENAFIDRQLVAGLVDALEDSDRMARRFAGDLLETEGRAVKQLERSRDALKELRCAPFRRLVGRPERRAEPRSWSRSDCPSPQGRAAPPKDSSTSSRCSRAACPACICAECDPDCRSGRKLALT